MDAQHKKFHIAVIVITPLVLAVTLVFNYLAAAAGGGGIFHNSTGDISNYYYLEITPAGWTFSIWGVIYIWQLLWIGYALSTICRKCSQGYLYLIPGHIPVPMYLVYWVNLACNVTWLLLWDRFLPEYALIPISLGAFTGYICLAITCISLHNSAAVLTREGLVKEIWLTIGLLHNGLGIYTAWLSIATLLNFGVVLTYTSASLPQEVSSTVALCVLALELGLWFMLDIFVLDRYVRYMVTPYLVFVVALSGSIDKNWDKNSSNSVFTAFLLALSCLLTIVKVITMLTRHAIRPLYQETFKPTTEKRMH